MPPEKEMARNAVVVIGAGSGIGKATAHRIAKKARMWFARTYQSRRLRKLQTN
jgi:NADP-dependent 3-hydroxy acid dehydrogenase YdfG